MKHFIIYIWIILLPPMATGQTIRGHHSESGDQSPELTWFVTGEFNPRQLVLKRAPLEEAAFSTIKSILQTEFSQDTTWFRAIDTTLSEQAICRYYLEAISDEADTLRSEMLFGHNLGSVAQPVISQVRLSSSDSMKAIRISWDLLYPETVQSVSVFKSARRDTAYQLIAVLPPETEFIQDPVIRSNENWYYFFLIKDFFGYQLPSPVFSGISTYREKPYAPKKVGLQRQGTRIDLSWEGLGNPMAYQVYRQQGERGSFMLCSPMLSGLNWTDTISEDAPYTRYGYYVVSVSDGFVPSAPSDTVYTDVPASGGLRSRISGLTAVSGDSLSVTLYWDLPPSESFILGYEVYRRSGEAPEIRLNQNVLPYHQNAFRDTSLSPGDTCRYRVVPVLTRPSEKGQAAETEIILPAVLEKAPFSLRKTEEGIRLEWICTPDIRNQKLEIVRQIGEGAPEVLATIAASQEYYVDGLTEQSGYYSYYLIWHNGQNVRLLHPGSGIKN